MLKPNDYVNMTKGVSDKAKVVRLRTWTLTLTIFIGLILLAFVQITFSKGIDLIHFAILAFVQIVMHFLYFPDGELFGQKNQTYISNKLAYNEKANIITTSGKINELREFCEFEYEERKEQYLLNELSKIGLTKEDYTKIKETTAPSEIKKLRAYLVRENVHIYFDRKKAKRLYELCCKELPIEKNNADTILSAIDNDFEKAIKDKTYSYKTGTHIYRIVRSTLIAFFLAYLGYSLITSFTLATLIKVFVDLTSMFTTAVMSFSKGEIASKVHKNNFYVALGTFIDRFNEWDKMKK